MASIHSFEELQDYLTGWLAEHGKSADRSRHKAFWDTMTYQEFITKDVPRFPGVKILIKGDGLPSQIVQSLLGVGLFGPDGEYPRMPRGGPYMSYSEIQPIIDWINNGCPEFATRSEEGGESPSS